MSTNPWDFDFTPAAVNADLLKTVQGAVSAGEAAVAQGVQTAENVIPVATQAAESVIPTVITQSSTNPTTNLNPTSANPIIAQTVESVIAAAAKGSAKQALGTLAPVLEAELVKEFQAGTQRVIGRVTGGTDVAPTPNLEDFVHADARSRALRTLLIGLVVAVLTGLGSAAAQLIHADWSTHDGQVAALTVAVGALASSVGAYISRLVSEPQVTKPLTAQLPSKAVT